MDRRGTGVGPKALSRWRTSRQATERAAVLVEAAIVVGLIAIVIAGILNYGALFGNSIDVAGATRTAALVGSTTQASSIGSVGDAQLIKALINKPGAKRSDLQRVVVYRAESASTRPPEACMNGTLPPASGEACNVYLPETFNVPTATITNEYLAASPGGSGWPASERDVGHDYLGVWVRVSNSSLINVVWTPDSYSDYFVVRMSSGSTSPGQKGIYSDGFLSSGNTPPPTIDTRGCWANQCYDDNNPRHLPGDGGGGGGGNSNGGGGGAA